MSAEATRIGVAPMAVHSHRYSSSRLRRLDIALFLRRLDEAVTLLAIDVRAADSTHASSSQLRIHE